MKKFVILIAFLTVCISMSAQVGINTDNSAPHQSAMLDVKSSSKGLLAPRMALTAINNPSPVSSPATGLLVYNTATTGTPPNNVIPGYYCWSGSKWMAVLDAPGVNPGDMQYWNGSQWVLIPAGSHGQQLYFCNGIPKWGGCLAQLSTTGITNITSSSAVSGGQITSDGGMPVTMRGVCWSTNPLPTITDFFTTNGSGTGSFVSSLTGLLPNMTYYVRSYATTSAGTGYGNAISFTTLCTTYLPLTISINASANPVCSGTLVNFSAETVNGGTSPSYQWKVNVNSISGATGATYSYIPVNHDSIRCIFTSPVPCLSGNPAISNKIVMSVNALPAPTAGTSTSTLTQITWVWSPVSGALGYKWNSVNNPATATDIGNITSKTDTGLLCGSLHYRYLWAYDSCGLSPALSLSKITLPCTGNSCGQNMTINHVAGTVAPVSKTTTYGTVTNIPGEPLKCWITSNLGADHQPAAPNDATEASSGWFWQFNRKQGFAHNGSTRTPNTPWINNIYENMDWQTANDPCNLELGGNWRIPSYSEWYNVDYAGGWLNWSGSWGAGLNLHASGFLDGSYGTLSSRGIYGFYRSNTQFDFDRSRELGIDNGFSGMNLNSKKNGFSVRCLRDT